MTGKVVEAVDEVQVIKSDLSHHLASITDHLHQSHSLHVSDRPINMVAFSSIVAALMAAGSALALPTAEVEVPSVNVTEIEELSLLKRGIGQGTGM